MTTVYIIRPVAVRYRRQGCIRADTPGEARRIRALLNKITSLRWRIRQSTTH